MRTRLVGTGVTVLLAIGTPTVWAGLQIGDPAPPLKMSHWLKGDPINLADGVGKNVYVLEFWATWCFPCIQAIPQISSLQKKYREQGVVVVAVTSAGGGPQSQTLDKVKSFVERQGAAMDYIVAFDESNKIDQEYLQPLGAMGIPHTVVIDKTGKVAWSGHPGAGLDQVIEELLSDSYKPDEFHRRRRADAALERAVPLAQRGMWPEAATALDEVLKIDPAHELSLRYKVQILTEQLGDREGLRKWATHYIEQYGSNLPAMMRLAEALLSIGTIENRQPELALKAARRAYETGKSSDALAAAIYAQAAFSIGMVDEAIRLQKEGLSLAADGEKTRQQAALDFYETCKRLQETL